MKKKKLILLCLIDLTISIATSQLKAETVTLQWDHNLEPDVIGYKVGMGLIAHTYTTITDVGNVTQATISTLSPGETYYFSVKAYNTQHMESLYGNEVSYLVPTITGFIRLCNSTPQGVPGITVNLSSTSRGIRSATTTNSNGKFTFFVPNGNYIVTPVPPPPLIPGSAGINTVDVIAISQIYLNLRTIECPEAADADLNGLINTVDVIATMQFFLNTPAAHIGEFGFRSVPPNYDFKMFTIGNVTP